MTVPANPTPDLRDRLVTALSMAGAYCGDCNFEPGDVGCADCQRCHRMYVDAVLGIVQPELNQLRADCQSYTDLACGAERTRQIHKADADQYEEQLRGERDRYRSAWLSARQRAEAYGEGILRHVEDRDTWKGWEKEQAARAIAAEVERDRLRTVARAAAVLLRATADRPSDRAALLAAAKAIDELAPKETGR